MKNSGKISVWKNRSLKYFAAGSALCTMLFFSCSDEAVDQDSPTQSIEKTQDFRLADAPSEPIVIKASESIKSDAFRATGAAGVDRGRYNISLKFLSAVDERQLEVFESAAARWERIIIKDVPSITGVVPSAFGGAPPAINGTADDVVIEVVLANIDGPFGILGQAGPRFIRNSDGLTLTGFMFFDIADLDFLDQLDLFEDVIVHEMGHVLGVGTLWNAAGRELRQGPVEDPYFAGRKANIFWNAEGGLFELPIENEGGPGTRLSHWRESILTNELMTGFLNLGENPLSRITAGSMKDLGYGAASVGEQYDLPRGTEGVNINELSETEGQGINIAKMEEIFEPIGVFIEDN